MKRLIPVAILSLALAGCSHMGHSGHGSAKPDPFNPKVWVVDGKIVVDQEPILLPKASSGAEVVFSFRMEPGTANEFPAGGIEFVQKSGPRTPITCVVSDKGKVHRCSYKNNGRAVWKYTIAVVSGGERLILDPHVVQD